MSIHFRFSSDRPSRPAATSAARHSAICNDTSSRGKRESPPLHRFGVRFERVVQVGADGARGRRKPEDKCRQHRERGAEGEDPQVDVKIEGIARIAARLEEQWMDCASR